MSPAIRITLAGLLVLAVAACASAPPPDLTPPAPRVDAKTQLEYGAPPPRR